MCHIPVHLQERNRVQNMIKSGNPSFQGLSPEKKKKIYAQFMVLKKADPDQFLGYNISQYRVF